MDHSEIKYLLNKTFKYNFINKYSCKALNSLWKNGKITVKFNSRNTTLKILAAKAILFKMIYGQTTGQFLHLKNSNNTLKSKKESFLSYKLDFKKNQINLIERFILNYLYLNKDSKNKNCNFYYEKNQILFFLKNTLDYKGLEPYYHLLLNTKNININIGTDFNSTKNQNLFFLKTLKLL